ncbi:P-loop NTPase fold protein [Ulvibacter litoralis]|uniref:KAP family P-loop domain-containing protein n=1 Tax=Ulvibacter litoralis TaxID=227084 RepID=A0A1G7C960_9FLAO|nr:P-loop NTPase fold protein [Ulvibacter litoralis]GHC48215.1 hypothetical protein GCM10008083_09400 [Ulvibacter litoralis]SDE35753.1 KAP family P-loop domain-containing protein [Ulvibacter litoralis]
MVQRDYTDIVKETLNAAYGFNLQKEVELPKGRPFKFSLGDPENKVVVDIRPLSESIEIEFISSDIVPYVGEAMYIFGPSVHYFLVYEAGLYSSDISQLESIISDDSGVNISILDQDSIQDLRLRHLPSETVAESEATKTTKKSQQSSTFDEAAEIDANAPNTSITEYNSSEFLALPEVQSRQFFVVGTQWGAYEQSQRFIDQGIWDNGTNEDVKQLVNTIQVGDILIQRADAENQKISTLHIKAMGVVTQLQQDNSPMKVNWALHGFGYSIPSIESYHDSIVQPSKEEITLLIETFNDFQLGDFVKHLTPLPLPHNTQTIAGILSDADIGVDYLNITKDIAAFSRVIAAKSFLPPLAIALFGKWGSGKSFFMRKLKEQIEELTVQTEGDHFCRGIAQVHFNAWSYMDSNLWASIVTRIFEGLQQYISNDTTAKNVKKEVEKALTSKLNSTNQELETLKIEKNLIDNKLSVLKTKRKKLEDDLSKKIKEIKENTLVSVLKNVDAEFDVQNKIEKAIRTNKSMNQNVEDFKEIIPEKYWKTPDEFYEQATAITTFLKVFFDKNKWWKNILWLLGIIIIILGVPLAVSYIGAVVGLTNLRLSPETWSLLTVAGGLAIRGINTYTKMQPLVASFWEIREDYALKKEEATQSFAQQQKALTEEIENYRREIEGLNQQIILSTHEQATLKFRLKNTLSTEALHSFIERKSESKDYAKHLGIISTIRKDFEILSELFTDHNDEVKKVKKEAAEQFKNYFEHPLERIILYIDDLDRCPEERVVEVLEAVNLLMAYPLFVVVVGVDPRWVKNALYKRHQLQFTSQTENSHVELIKPSAYLEKIFQVPFNLKKPSDTSVKFMLKSLAETQPVAILSSENASESFTGSLDDTATIETTTEASEGTENKNETLLKPNDANEESVSLNTDPSLSEVKKPQPIEIESLTFSKTEITLIQTMSPIVGGSPRAIKRFINIFRIVKAHEDYPNNLSADETKVVLFLLALPLGNYKKLYAPFIDKMKNHSEIETFESFFMSFKDATYNGKEVQVLASELQEIITLDKNNLGATPLASFSKQFPLLKRFSYVID